MNILKNLFYFIFLSITLCCCKRDMPLFEIHNLNGNIISCFGHGGMGIGFEYPIDTWQSIEPCLRIGADGTEMDVQMTKDSVLVAYHNNDLNESTLCNGTINDYLWSDIWGCHFASPISTTVNLKSVSDIFDAADNSPKYTFTFDCKLYSNNADQLAFKQQYANAVIRLINDHNILSNNIYLESQDTVFLRILKTKRPDLKLFIYPSSFESGLSIAKTMSLFGITTANDDITAEQLALAHDNGIHVCLWNVTTQKEHEAAFLKSPDFIQSDDIIYLLKVFGKYKD